MLILSRRVGKSIVIGEAVKVKVLGIRNGQIKIAIDVPQDLEVHRESVGKRIVATGNHPRL